MQTKEDLARELSRYLQVGSVNWQRLPKKDLVALYEAFEKLKREVMELFALVDEMLDTPLTLIPEKKEWRNYTI